MGKKKKEPTVKTEEAKLAFKHLHPESFCRISENLGLISSRYSHCLELIQQWLKAQDEMTALEAKCLLHQALEEIIGLASVVQALIRCNDPATALPCLAPRLSTEMARVIEETK